MQTAILIWFTSSLGVVYYLIQVYIISTIADVYDTKFHSNMNKIAKQYTQTQHLLNTVFLVLFLSCVVCSLLSISTLWVAIALKTKPTDAMRRFLRNYKRVILTMMPIIAILNVVILGPRLFCISTIILIPLLLFIVFMFSFGYYKMKKVIEEVSAGVEDLYISIIAYFLFICTGNNQYICTI